MKNSIRLSNGQTLRLLEVAKYPEWLEKAVSWFHEKWHIPEEAYRESMEASIQNPESVPNWYVVVDEKSQIVGGAGIIENDFHARKDLRPNVCALYVEEPWRKQGVARFLLDTARADAGKMGLERLYLITDHEDFYEKCGWSFLTMVECDGGETSRIYEAPARV